VSRLTFEGDNRDPIWVLTGSESSIPPRATAARGSSGNLLAGRGGEEELLDTSRSLSPLALFPWMGAL